MEYLIYRGKVRSFDTQTYLQVYVYVTLCHGSLQVSQYRSGSVELKLKEILDSENSRRLDDRSGCIVDYDGLRSQIDELYNQIISGN